MNGRRLLDTNIVIALLEKEVAVSERLAGAAEIFLSAITLGELYYGAAKSSLAQQNTARQSRNQSPAGGSVGRTSRFASWFSNQLWAAPGARGR